MELLAVAIIVLLLGIAGILVILSIFHDSFLSFVLIVCWGIFLLWKAADLLNWATIS